MNNINEITLNFEQRLGLAYCRLNSWQWDSLIGPKPDNFDNIKDSKVKSDYLNEAIQHIERIIGKNNCSKYWWLFVLNRSEDEWAEWYYKNCDFFKVIM